MFFDFIEMNMVIRVQIDTDLQDLDAQLRLHTYTWNSKALNRDMFEWPQCPRGNYWVKRRNMSELKDYEVYLKSLL